MMRIVSAIVLAFCSMWLLCQPAFAERRIALVFGNSGYERVPQLPNPVNDATSMSEMFKKAGFDTVVLKLDVKAQEMRRALREQVTATLRAVAKLGGQVELVAHGSLPNDGKVIADER